MRHSASPKPRRRRPTRQEVLNTWKALMPSSAAATAIAESFATPASETRRDEARIGKRIYRLFHESADELLLRAATDAYSVHFLTGVQRLDAAPFEYAGRHWLTYDRYDDGKLLILYCLEVVPQFKIDEADGPAIDNVEYPYNRMPCTWRGRSLLTTGRELYITCRKKAPTP